MPSQSAKQHRLMEAIASGSFKKKGLSPSVAKEFVAADKGHKFGSGGQVKKKHGKPRMSPAMLAALSAPPPGAAGPPPGMGGPPPPGMGGPPPGPPMGMKKGGKVDSKPAGTRKQVTRIPLSNNKNSDKHIGGGIERKAKTSTSIIAAKGSGMAAKGKSGTERYASGGSVRGHGMESSGRTKGRFV